MGRLASDHGSPAWEPMWIYHNTILAGDPPRYDYGTDGLGGAMGHGVTRRVFNNIVCQMIGMVGQTLPEPAVDFQADGNLFWSVSHGPEFSGPLFGKFRNSPAFLQSQKQYDPGWTAHDRFADPQFVRLDPDWRQTPDLRLSEQSPAVNAGVALPEEWPDPLRRQDDGAPDIGAVPRGRQPWRVGVRGRLNVFGEQVSGEKLHEERERQFPATPPETRPHGRALIVQGYPAFDAPLIAYALRRRGTPVDLIERTWVEPSEFRHYRLVVIDGSFTRAGIRPDKFSEEDVAHVRRFLHEGGSLVLMRERTDLFATPHGRQFLEEAFGAGSREPQFAPTLLRPNHPWVRHLSGDPGWLPGKGAAPLRTSRGESVIGTPAGASLLHRSAVGDGEIIYVGWSIAGALPPGRQPSTLSDEATFEEQMQILVHLLDDFFADELQ